MRIALIAPPGLFADSFHALLAQIAEHTYIIRAGATGVERMAPPPDGVVVDIAAATPETVRSVQDLVERCNAPVIALADAADGATMNAVLQTGVAAYIPRTFSGQQALAVIREALRDPVAADDSITARRDPIAGAQVEASRDYIVDNPHKLTPTEIKVLALMCEGCSNFSIAKRLSIATGTAKLHASHIYDKLDVTSRTQAIIVGMRMKIIRDLLMQGAQAVPSLYAWLLPHMTHHVEPRGKVLFRKGELGNALYYIQSGQVGLREFGKSMRAGEFLGEIAIFSPEKVRTCTAVCETDTKVFALPAEQAKRLYFENPQFAFHIVQLIAQRIARVGVSEPSDAMAMI